MPSMLTVVHRGETLFQRLDGLPFFGTVQPANEGTVPSNDFIASRLLLRVSRDCQVNTKDVAIDSFGRHFLLCDHDETPWYRVHRMMFLNKAVVWARATTTADTLTGLAKGTTNAPVAGSPIWIALEPFGREQMDLTLRVSEQVRRVITGSDVLLGDLVDDMIVKRLDKTLGVWLAEIQ